MSQVMSIASVEALFEKARAVCSRLNFHEEALSVARSDFHACRTAVDRLQRIQDQDQMKRALAELHLAEYKLNFMTLHKAVFRAELNHLKCMIWLEEFSLPSTIKMQLRINAQRPHPEPGVDICINEFMANVNIRQ